MDKQSSEQSTPKQRSRKPVPWRKDPRILARLVDVERYYHERLTNVAIAALLHVDEATIRTDIKRLQELWLERHGAAQDECRAEVLAELDDIKVRALAAAKFDEAAERAVLLNEELLGADGKTHFVQRDDKGSAQFRGNKAASLTVARQAIMDKAKVKGIIVDKQEVTGKDGGPLAVSVRPDLKNLSDEELVVVKAIFERANSPAVDVAGSPDRM